MTEKGTIAIFGASGFIGAHIFSSIKKNNSNHFQIIGTYNSNKTNLALTHLDIINYQDISSFFEYWSPKILIICSGLKDVNRCEENFNLAYTLNTQPLKDIIRIIRDNDYTTYIILLSTDYVFSGNRGLYTDEDIPSPRTNYGKTKYLAELELQKSELLYTIIRTSAVMGAGSTFFEWLIQSLKQNKDLELFDDIFFTPTPIDLITSVIDELVNKPNIIQNQIIHLTGNCRISRYQLGLQLKDILRSKSIIKPISGLNRSNLFQHDLSLITSKPYQYQSKTYMDKYIKSIYDSAN